MLLLACFLVFFHALPVAAASKKLPFLSKEQSKQLFSTFNQFSKDLAKLYNELSWHKFASLDELNEEWDEYVFEHMLLYSAMNFDTVKKQTAGEDAQQADELLEQDFLEQDFDDMRANNVQEAKESRVLEHFELERQRVAPYASMLAQNYFLGNQVQFEVCLSHTQTCRPPRDSTITFSRHQTDHLTQIHSIREERVCYGYPYKVNC